MKVNGVHSMQSVDWWADQVIFSASIMLFFFSTAGETVSVGFEQTSYQTSENGPLNEEVCAVVSNLMGDLECDLAVTFRAVSNNKTGKFHASIQQCDTLCLV